MARKFQAGTGVIKEKPQDLVKPGVYNRADLHPNARPNAVSHDATHFDSLHSAMEELRGRLEDQNISEREQKNPDYVRVLSTVRAHLDEARKHFDNAYAAHATGGLTAEAKLRAGHTAVESYRRAATHVADALNFMKGEAGFGVRVDYDEKKPIVSTDPATGKKKYEFAPKPGKEGGIGFKRRGTSNLGLKILSNEGRAKLITHHELNGLVNGYQAHVRSSLSRAGVEVPQGVADKTAEFKQGEPPSQLSQESLGKRGYPLTYTEELAAKAKKRDVKEMQKKQRMSEWAKTTGRTHVLGETGEPVAKSGSNPYAGVGITGFSGLLDAVATHYNKTFGHTGVSFIGSDAHKNPVEYAKKYNVKLPGAEKTVETTLKRMGPTTAGVTAGQLSRDIESQPAGVPKLSKTEKKSFGEANVPNKAAVGNVLNKGRRAQFNESGEGAKS